MKKLSLLVITATLLSSCKRDPIGTDPGNPNSYSVETLYTIPLENQFVDNWYLKFGYTSGKLVIPTKDIIFGEVGLLGLYDIDSDSARTLDSQLRSSTSNIQRNQKPLVSGPYVIFESTERFQCFNASTGTHVWASDVAIQSSINHGYTGAHFYEGNFVYVDDWNEQNSTPEWSIISTPVNSYQPDTVFTQAEFSIAPLDARPNFRLAKNSNGDEILTITCGLSNSLNTLVKLINLSTDQVMYTDTINEARVCFQELLIQDDRIVIPLDKRICSYNLNSGSRTWYTTPLGNSRIDSKFFIYEDELFYASTSNDAWVSINVNTGMRTSRDIPEIGELSLTERDFKVTDGTLYYTTALELRAIDLATGEHLISPEDSRRLGEFTGGPIYVPELDILFAHTQDEILAIRLKR
ncbi:MAG: hypothetical protein HWD92_04015 [Flavobacteriia bacterium]|nr:hypothetical protein [Flavobacteriia bacterium]